MNPPTNIGSVEALRRELTALVTAYAQHFDPWVRPELHTVRLEIVGPHVTVIYAEAQNAGPTLSITLSELTDPASPRKAS